jgi:hypothetical protein
MIMIVKSGIVTQKLENKIVNNDDQVNKHQESITNKESEPQLRSNVDNSDSNDKLKSRWSVPFN